MKTWGRDVKTNGNKTASLLVIWPLAIMYIHLFAGAEGDTAEAPRRDTGGAQNSSGKLHIWLLHVIRLIVNMINVCLAKGETRAAGLQAGAGNRHVVAGWKPTSHRRPLPNALRRTNSALKACNFFPKPSVKNQSFNEKYWKLLSKWLAR
jgi:hypothetical protein